MNRKVVIIDALRTPMGRSRGGVGGARGTLGLSGGLLGARARRAREGPTHEFREVRL